jgi:hypothetical protein
VALHTIKFPVGEETIRLELPDGRTYRIAPRDDGVLRVALEGVSSAEVYALYVHPGKGQAIVGIRGHYTNDEATT